MGRFRAGALCRPVPAQSNDGVPHVFQTCMQDKYVFPVDLGVTKLSGSGADCIFLGVMKAVPVRGGF